MEVNIDRDDGYPKTEPPEFKGCGNEMQLERNLRREC